MTLSPIPNFKVNVLPLSKWIFFSLLFFYFIVSPADILNVNFLAFKAKLTNLTAILFFLWVIISQPIKVPKNYLTLTLYLLICMAVSCCNSSNLVVCIAFMIFFVFSFLFYFVLPYNLFNFIDTHTILKIYRWSFYCVGFYACLQVLFSCAQIILPGVTQYIQKLARGQAFSYEPSYYALYMTPFTIYCTAKYILQNSKDRKITDLIWSNIFLFASTSTGCFFSYLSFIFFLCFFKMTKIIKEKISLIMIATKSIIATGTIFLLVWFTNKNLIISGLLKFFYSGGTSHFSVSDRLRGIIEYWNIFLEHPLIGIGFGSGPFYLAQKKDPFTYLLDPNVLNTYAAMNVTTEILAGIGVIGSFGFICLLYSFAQTFRNTLRIEALKEDERIILISLALSICVMFITLQFNQSIMRPYIWIHLGIFTGFTQHLKQKYVELR